jgi:serine/threonine protein kinase
MTQGPEKTGRRTVPKKIGAYDVLSLLGEGGMGIVYLAKDTQGREVALKVIKESFAGDTDVTQRFEREAYIALSLIHPNIVRTYDAGTIEGKLFLACEVIRGGSLANLLDKEKRLPEARALKLFRDLMAALDAVDRAGLIHRDVKPGNILMDQAGAAKLSDLGLARATSVERTKLTRTGVLMGTPDYLAPEQIYAAKLLDIRADLYSSGILLYECLAGEPPFHGSSLVDLLNAHLEGAIPDVSEAVPGVRPEVKALIDDLLQKTPERRPQRPAQVLARVDALLGKAHVPDLAPPQRHADLVPFPATLREVDLVEPDESPTVIPMAATRRLHLPIGKGALERAKLVVASSSGERVLFVYAKRTLEMGRDGLQIAGQDVCLRLRPGASHEAENRHIARKQLRLSIEGLDARVEDLGKAGAVKLDGRPLPVGLKVLPPRSLLEIAGLLELSLSLVRPDGSAPAIKGIGEPDPSAPALLIERPKNGSEHAYVLVPGMLRLGVQEGSLVPGGQGAELLTASGLWLVLGEAQECRPLVEGLTFSIQGVDVRVGEIRPEDQK